MGIYIHIKGIFLRKKEKDLSKGIFYYILIETTLFENLFQKRLIFKYHFLSIKSYYKENLVCN